MATETAYDLVVIGGGAGGLVAAVGAAMFGARVALIEKRSFLGGDCLNFGCVPSKALLRTAHAAHEVRHASRFGIEAGSGHAHFGDVIGYVRGVISHLGAHDDPERFRRLGVEVLLGEAPTFVGPRQLQVGQRVLTARRFVIATGSRPAKLPLTGLPPGTLHDNESIFTELDQLPARLLVIGGGPIGVELGQAFARLGSQVTLAEAGPRLLSKEEPEASAVVTRVLRAEGLAVLTDTRVVAAEASGPAARVTFGGAGAPAAPAEFDALLAAAGRRPNVEGLGLEAAGVRLDDRGFIAVDQRLRTSAPHIYALGDVIGRFPFTHMAEAEAKVALRNVLFPGWSTMDYSVVPWATFCDPEVARVGALEADLVAAGTPYRAFSFPFEQADRAQTDAATDGFVKLLTTPRGRVLGATIVGERAGELIHTYVLAMRHGLSVHALSRTIHVYPTLTLANRRAADLFTRELLEKSLGGRLLRWWVGGAGRPGAP